MAIKLLLSDERLLVAYTEAANQMLRILSTANGRNRQRILAQIDAILSQLDELTAEYIQEGLPEQFRRGSDEAIRELRKVSGFGEIDSTFGLIHTAAIQVLADNARLSFGNSLQATRNGIASRLTSLEKERVLREIIQKEISGQVNVRLNVRDIFAEQGISGFRTSNGRSISLEVYANTLVETLVAEAHNTGAITRYVANGITVGRVIERETACDICFPMKNKLIALDVPALAPPYHPHCRGTVVPVIQPKNSEYVIKSADDSRIPSNVRKFMRRT